jgi:hypothetical protein
VDIAHDSLKEWQAHNGIARNGPPLTLRKKIDAGTPTF